MKIIEGELAGRQHGLVTATQAKDLGLTGSAILHRVRSGRWEPLGTGVYRLVGTERTWAQRLHGLVLASGPVAAASHRSAAALLGIPGFDRAGPVEVVTPRPRRHRDPEYRVHRWRVLPPDHLTVIEGIPTTRVPRTLMDLAGVLHPARTERAVDNCLAARTATLGSLRAAFIDLARPGRKGIAIMRRLLDERSDGYVAPASDLEACFVALIRRHGLPQPARQVDVGDGDGWIGRVDFAYLEIRLIIELDSGRHHTSKLDVESDRERDRRLRAAGWRIERLTWNDLLAVGPVVKLLRDLLAPSGDGLARHSASDRHQLVGA